MPVKLISPDLRRYVKQLGDITPRKIQLMTGAGLRESGKVYEDKLRQEIELRGTSLSRRRPKLKHTVSSRVFTRVAHAPNAALYVGTRSNEPRPKGTISAGQRLSMLEGTRKRTTRKGYDRGKIDPRNILRNAIQKGQARAFAVFEKTVRPLMKAELQPRRRGAGGARIRRR